MHIREVFLITALVGVDSVTIRWDNNVPVEYNFFDQGRSNDQVRVPNWFLIYPGTKWCGAGNVAENENDLGDFWKTDKCCRNHDRCDSYIRGYQTNYNLTNNSFYTRLHCNCDQMFRECLKSVDTLDSKTIGGIYFNALGTQCFKEEHPVVKCTKHIYFPRKKCVNYELNTAEDPIYQWFDVPSF